MNIVIIGHGGHSKVISDIILANKGFKVYGYLDYKYEKIEIINNFLCGPLSAAKQIIEEYTDAKFVIAIGDNKVRKSIIKSLGFVNEKYATFVHPLAYVSPSAKLGFGTVLMANSVINADAVIGDHCIINSCSVVEHDSILADFVHLCPNSTIAGTAEIGEGTCVGSGATIIPNKKIGGWTTIGAGATVVNHIPDNCIAVGTPARVKLNKKVNMG